MHYFALFMYSQCTGTRNFNQTYVKQDKNFIQFLAYPCLFPKSFPGNVDSATSMTNSWYLHGDAPLRAKYIRIKPTSWHGHISLRLGILGCGRFQGHG